MKYLNVALALAVACAPALAQDDPTKKPEAPAAPPTAPAPKAEAKPEAKKERKVDPAAAKALERHVGLVHLPTNSGIKNMSGKGDFDQQGSIIGINPKWTAEAGFDFDVTIPDDIKQKAVAMGAPADGFDEIAKKQLSQLVNLWGGISGVFEAPGKMWDHFDLTVKPDGEDLVVELTPFDDQADADGRSYKFGKDGLLKSASFAPKGDTPQGEQMKAMGITIDTEWRYEKKGEKNLVVGRTLTIGPQQIETTFAYFDGPNGSFLPKTATISTPQGDQVVKFHDYTVDGKFVDGTKAEPPKPVEKPAAKPPETPAEKPAEKPADGPPAPMPPAPKQDGK